MNFNNFKNILLTGATGNTSYFFLKKLEKENFNEIITVITRYKSKNSYFDQFKLKFRIFNGNIDDKNFLSECLDNIDLVLHTANIENSKNIVEVGNEKKVKWFILVHSTMVYSKHSSPRIENRRNIEKDILEKNSNITILSSSMIYGTSRDINMSRLIRFMDKFKIFPIFGDGQNYMQPIYIEDLAIAFFKIIENKNLTFNKRYILAGKEPIKYIDMLKIIEKKLKKKIIYLKIPLKLSIFLIKICEIIFFKKLHINTSQVERLSEDKIYDYSNAKNDFLFAPRNFEEGIEIQINKYKNTKK
jgi:nucleoside-diphosphate-sugar epimerase|tara:strand:- start:2504 stop:3409 length:906 start_codon:yes stop_codon:yes gene_type:complete